MAETYTYDLTVDVMNPGEVNAETLQEEIEADAAITTSLVSAPLSAVNVRVSGISNLDITFVSPLGPSEVTALDAVLAAHTGEVISSFFEPAEFESSSLTVSTTASNNFQQKLQLAVEGLEAGKYRFGFSYAWNHDSAKNDFEAKIQHDGSATLMEHRQEPKDASGSWQSTGTDQKHRASGFLYLQLPSGDHIFDLTYRTTTNNNSSSIWDAGLELRRVS